MSQPSEFTPQPDLDTTEADRACAEMKAHLHSAKRMVEQARRALSEPLRSEEKSFLPRSDET